MCRVYIFLRATHTNAVFCPALEVSMLKNNAKFTNPSYLFAFRYNRTSTPIFCPPITEIFGNFDIFLFEGIECILGRFLSVFQVFGL